LREFFEGVYGSPNSKSYWTKQLIEERNFDVNKVFFVGDALSDYRAAEENNIRFIARITDGNEVFKGKKVSWKIRDLFDLDNLLSEEKLE
jgi:histidinol phosphatase-like enzyme